MLEKELVNKLHNINTTNISYIQIRTIGLLDVFGKMLIDISYNDDTTECIELISPVPINVITEWLERNNLFDKTKLYKF